MAIKKTLLQIVQSILSDMDSEDVNSISDSVEAAQVASIVEDTFYNVIATRFVPEHEELFKPTALSDSDYPTHFEYPTNHKKTYSLWYKDSDSIYHTIKWLDPYDFLIKSDGAPTPYDTVNDKNGGTQLRIRSDKDPEYYTSFDDRYIIMDSYDSTREATLQETNIRAYGALYPVFSQTDSYVPDLDGVYFPYLIAESKSVAMSLLKGQSDPKVEQAARRQKSYIQNDRYNTVRANNWSTYGR